MGEAPGVHGIEPSRESASPLRFAGFLLDLDACVLARESGEAIALTRSEFAVLRMFVARPGRVISRDTLLDAFANRRFEPFDRSVDVLVGKLRRKIEVDPKRPRLIVTVPGEGYRFDGLRFNPPQIAKLADADAAAKRAVTPIAAPASEGARPPAEAASRAAERRYITALAAELVWAEVDPPNDPEDLRVVIDTFRRLAAEALGRYGGAIAESRGREIAAYFGHRQAQENDAERAVRAALAIQCAQSETNAHNAGDRTPQFAARIGLDSGQVVVEAMGEVFGDAPNVAARVQALADPGTVLITARVHRQVAGLFVAEDRGAHALKGAPEPTTLFRIVRASGGRRFGARVLTPLVGREEELDLLRRRWERAVKGEGQLALIVGEPGIGKSRLIEEFRAGLGETPHTFVEWSSSQLLQNTPWHPIAEWGRQRFGADEPAARRLADLENTLRQIGLDPSEYAPLLAPLVDIPLPEGCAAKLAPEDLRRRQLAALIAWLLAGARSQPAALAFEDLHWADPTSLDLMQALAERSRAAPLFIIATARPEFRPSWSLRSHHSVISLSPLDRADVAQMVGELAAHHALSKEVVEGVSERTGGVPLFVEEVTRLLLERGEAGGLQALPPTLQQSLVARLDRLGEAREVAQIGAVLGRDFIYSLLRAVGGVLDPALQSALDKLAGADLLIVEGAGHEANYRFKHALIQDAAYDTLLKSRRQTLHRRVAEVLRDQPERAAAEPEVIAHHFTEAGLDDLAIEWWGKAGDQALRRSAFQEAIAHLFKAIEMSDREGYAGERRNRGAPASSHRLKLQNDYAKAIMWSKGFAAEETKVAFSRAVDLAATTDYFSERFAAGYGHWAARLIGGECREAEDLARRLVQEAEIATRGRETARARIALGNTCFFEGKLPEAKSIFECVLADCGLAGASVPAPEVWTGRHVFTASYLANVVWLGGEAEYARRLSDEAIRRASELGHAQTSAQAHYARSFLEILRDNPAATLRSAELAIAIAREHGMQLYAAVGEVHSTWARSRLPSPEVETAELRRVIGEYVKLGNRIALPLYLGLLAEGEVDGGGIDAALATIHEALALASKTGERLCDAFLYRLRGDILCNHASADPGPSERAYKTAIAVAKEQGARSLELRAALSLAKLYQSNAQPAEAHAVLAPALEGFSPTPEMPEIAEAKELLAALAETDEVKAEAARRQQRRPRVRSRR